MTLHKTVAPAVELAREILEAYDLSGETADRVVIPATELRALCVALLALNSLESAT